MRTYVITGGTDGIGAALARALLARGDHAVVIGTNRGKAERIAAGEAGQITFVPADLSLVSDTRRTIDVLKQAHPVIDGLVLCARYFRSRRRVTAEGFEDNFALFYLSRALFSYGLLEPLTAAGRPVIVNVAGPGHRTPIDWTDLQSQKRYDGVEAMFLTGRLNDLLGVSFAERHGGGPVRYVLMHPGTTSTGFVGDFDPATARFIEQQKAVAKPAADVAPAIMRLLDDPPAAPLSAFNMYRPLTVDSDLFSPAQASVLAEMTAAILPA
ncbi:hypothetical protein GCM10023170_075830 [Phytohabitans houttuyneae]|uniref:SDR family NAD(P)-dependent oxidoreductase n=1 Tax=Phytohabitans houttuyneae TaxID=1076126 RepID=UPI0031EE767A